MKAFNTQNQAAPKIVGGDKAHATFSASGAERWLKCAGSITLSEQAPPQKDNIYSLEGTDAHECLETILKNPARRLAIEKELRLKFPDDMVTHAARAADEILGRADEMGGELFCEQKVDSSHFTRPGEFGTLDAAIVTLFGTLEVIDFKYGFKVVEPENNAQLIYYALALAYKYDYQFTEIRLTVIQPRAEHEDGFTRTAAMSIDDLLTWVPRFKKGVKAALGPNPSLVSGPHCKYCNAVTICKEFSERAFQEAKIDFSPVLDTLEVPEARGLDNDTIASILKHADAIEHWLSEVRALAFTKLTHGEDIRGFKLVEKRASRKWANIEKVEREAEKVFGEIAFSRSLLSPAQLEKVTRDAKPWVAKRCVAISSGTTIAPDSDKRPAYSLASDFEAIEDKSVIDISELKKEKGGAHGNKEKSGKKENRKKEIQ